jgi:hypothetical protein
MKVAIVKKFHLMMVRLVLGLADWGESLLERFDYCCYPGCENRADTWCITGGHRHCYEHESGYYSDVEMCQSCFEEMTPEEIAQDQKEQEEFELGDAHSER